MSTKTTNYQFVKPEGTDALLPDAFNDDLDAIDKELKNVNDAVEAVANKVGNADTTLEEVATKLSEHDTKLSEHDTSITELNKKVEEMGNTPHNIATAKETNMVLNGESAPDTPDVPEENTSVFGVVWEEKINLTRLTPDTDPNNLVTETVEIEPVAQSGLKGGYSPFDEFAPWSKMKKCNLSADGNVKAWDGDDAFSDADPYVMVFIPEFWVAAKTDGSKRYLYIANKAVDGMTKHPGSGKYVGRYLMPGSTTGNTPKVYATRATMREEAKNIGPKWYLFDFATYCAVLLLYLVEYANGDSQEKLGSGYAEAGKIVANGETDSTFFHTGNAATYANEIGSVHYRFIESLWGNAGQWVDGFNANARKAYYCDDPSKYADDTIEGYTEIGDLSTTNWIADIMITENGLIIPTKSAISSTVAAIPDAVYSTNSGWSVLEIGGSYKDEGQAGIMFFNAKSGATTKTLYTGARLECEA